MRVSAWIRRAVGLAAATGVVVATALATTAPAEAAAAYKGKIIAQGGLKIRTAPTIYAGSPGSIARGTTIMIDCKVVGSRVDGNRLWYALSGNRGWVAARYVENIGAAPILCPSAATEYGEGRTTATVNRRLGPTTRDVRVGTLASGTRVTVRCYVSSQRIGETRLWYLLTNGSWITAAYVKRLAIPATNWVPCTE